MTDNPAAPAPANADSIMALALAYAHEHGNWRFMGQLGPKGGTTYRRENKEARAALRAAVEQLANARNECERQYQSAMEARIAAEERAERALQFGIDAEQANVDLAKRAKQLEQEAAALRELLKEARAFVNDHPGELAGKLIARIDAALEGE